MPDFSIEYDTASKRWVPAAIRVRMLSRDQNGQYNPCDFHTPEFACEPAGWLSFSLQEEGEIVAASVAVTDQFVNYKSTDKFSKPVRVYIKALPVASGEAQPEPLNSECNVYVAEPAQAMGYTVSPDECWKDSEIWLMADGQSTCKLTVWVEEVDAATGEVFRAPDEDFEFRLESSFKEDTLICSELDKGIIPLVSTWCSANSMPELKEPLRGKLVVKAFSRIKPSDRQNGKLEIPFVLCPAKVAVDVTFSPELPAQPGQEITARIKLRQEALNAPLANIPVQFVWGNVSQKNPLGSILTESASTDSEGLVELRYAAPAELDYKAKERFYDEITIMLGDGKKAAPLEKTIIIPVAPRIKLACLTEKKGLQQDTAVEAIEILPEQVTGGEVRGCLILPVEMPGGPRKLFGVTHARFTPSLGEEAIQLPQQKTAGNGQWKVKLPEIEEAFKKAELKAKVILLPSDPEKKQVFKTLPDQEQEERIKGFETDLTPGRLKLYSQTFQKKLQYYRYHFCSQLAAKKEEDLDLAVAGVQLLIAAVKGSDTFFRRFKGHEDLVKSRLEGLLSSVISILLNMLEGGKQVKSAGGWLAKKGKAIIEWLAKSRFGRLIVRGSSWLGDFVSNLGDKATKQIPLLLKRIRSSIIAFLEGLGKMGTRLLNNIRGILDDVINLIDDLAVVLQTKITAFRDMLAGSINHWDELVTWANRAKTAADDALIATSDWVSKFIGALQEVFETVVNIVATLFTRLGRLIYRMASAFIGWACQKAKSFATWVLDWLCSHSDKVKAEVERIIREIKTPDSTADKGLEGVLDFLLNEFINKLTSQALSEDPKDSNRPDDKVKFTELGRQPNLVVGNVYKYACKQHLERDWEPVRRHFSREIVDASGKYGDYEIATAKVDEINNIVSTTVSCVSLGIALLGIVFSGGTAVVPFMKAMALVDKAFNIFKAAVIDIPQIGIAVYVMFGLVLKYDLLVTGLCFGESGGSS